MQVAMIELLREAMAAARANDKPRTRALLVEVTRRDARNETAWQWLAGVAESPLEVVAALERVLALNPENEKAKAAIGPARLQAGITAAKAKDAPAARRFLRAVLAAEPRNEHAWVWLASVAESPAEALTHLERVLALNPENAAARKGVSHYKAVLAETPPPKATVRNGEPVSARTPANIPVPKPPRAAPAPTPPRTVLVVDDSRTIRKLVGMTMAEAGFRVVEAESGADAIDRIGQSGVPDLILLDVAMPGMDGYEFCRLVRHNPETSRVPVIMLTGKDGFFDKIRGRLAGTSAYLAKPLQPETLLRVVEKHCPGRG